MIIRKSPREIKIMKQANQIVAETHAYLEEEIKPGISTADLNRMADEYIRGKGAVPSFKGYRGFPASICVSINEEVVHGIPSQERLLEEGDIVSIDIGTLYQGFNGDAARTFPVGEVSGEVRRLLEVTSQSLAKAIEQAVVGNRLTDISHAVQSHAEAHGYSVVREYVGHGIGREMHEDPQIPNFGPPGRGPVLKAGMTFAIEPMVNTGGFGVETLDNGWTVVTKDSSLSAHFENTIALTEEGPEVLSQL
ncbi:MAG: type I methionyl aminopeptidase [Bacillota bacterium]